MTLIPNFTGKSAHRKGLLTLMVNDPAIPFNMPVISSKDVKAAQESLSSGWIAEGKSSKDLQVAFNHMLGGGHSRVTTSGTAALFLALKFLSLPPKSRIALPTYACTALLDAIHLVGHTPFLVDIDPVSPNIDLDFIFNLPAKQQPDAIIGIHSFGIPIQSDLIEISPVKFIEDCCHSIGGYVDGKPIGSFGDASVFSFYATKIITGGIGGLVFSKNHTMIGEIDKYLHPAWNYNCTPQFNFRISDINTSIILSQFNRIDEIKQQRQYIYDVYQNALDNPDLALHVRKDDIMPYRFVVQANSQEHQNRIAKHFLQHGIEVSTLYKPQELLHHRIQLDKTLFPNSERLAHKTVALPLHLNLSDENIEFIVTHIRSMPKK